MGCGVSSQSNNRSTSDNSKTGSGKILVRSGSNEEQDDENLNVLEKSPSIGSDKDLEKKKDRKGKKVSISSSLPTYKNGTIVSKEAKEEIPNHLDDDSALKKPPSETKVEPPKEEASDAYVADMYIPHPRKSSLNDETPKLKVGERISVMSSTGRKLSYGSITYVGKGKSKVIIQGRKSEEWQSNEVITKICEHCDIPIPYKLLNEQGEHISCYYATTEGQFLKAAKLGNITLCKSICENNAKIFTIVDPDGNNALHNAASNNQVLCMEYLLGEPEGQSLLEQPNKHGLTPLLQASIYAASAQYLLDKGANLQAITDLGDTLLHLAAKFGSLSVVQIAVERGIAINSINKVSQTALHLAADSGHTDCVKWLLENGSSPNLEDKMKRKALDMAYDYTDITRLLCESMGIPLIQMEKTV